MNHTNFTYYTNFLPQQVKNAITLTHPVVPLTLFYSEDRNMTLCSELARMHKCVWCNGGLKKQHVYKDHYQSSSVIQYQGNINKERIFSSYALENRIKKVKNLQKTLQLSPA